MRKKLKTHVPCPRCGSSDANTIYEDGEWCFSCGTGEKDVDNFEETAIIIRSLPRVNSSTDRGATLLTTKLDTVKKYINFRGLNQDTLEKFSIQSLLTKDGEVLEHLFPYPNGAIKHKGAKIKEFYASGPMSTASLFGMDKWSPGSAKSITITEGELDAASVYQMMGNYPCVSVRGATSAKQDCQNAHKYLNSFEKIYLCFDNDEPGQKAAKEVATLFDINKVYFVEMGGDCKDANDYLTKGKQEEFRKLWWNSKRYCPKGIVNTNASVAEILRSKGASTVADYPFPTLNEMTYGMREGEMILFTALEKVGKTEIIRAIEHKIIKDYDYKIGIIHLEEEEKRSVQGLLSYEFDLPCHLPDCNISTDEQIKKYEELVKKDGRVNYYTHFGSDDPDTILDVIRYLVAVEGCKFIFLDHITMLVTGFEGDDERKKLDYISTRLAMMTRELKFTLICVSHVNDNGQTRGSRNISKVADLIIHLDRNTEAESFDERNTTSLMVKGNRFAGRSGPAGYLRFDPHTYKVRELTGTEAERDAPEALPF